MIAYALSFAAAAAAWAWFWRESGKPEWGKVKRVPTLAEVAARMTRAINEFARQMAKLREPMQAVYRASQELSARMSAFEDAARRNQ